MAGKDNQCDTGIKLNAQQVIQRLNNLGYHVMYTTHGRVMCWHGTRKDDSFLKKTLSTTYLEALRRTEALKIS